MGVNPKITGTLFRGLVHVLVAVALSFLLLLWRRWGAGDISLVTENLWLINSHKRCLPLVNFSLCWEGCRSTGEVE